MTNMQKDAMAYSTAILFIKDLRRNRNIIPDKKYMELRAQALSGDINGAVKGLAAALKEIGR